jgi:hypothetical protein
MPRVAARRNAVGREKLIGGLCVRLTAVNAKLGAARTLRAH